MFYNEDARNKFLVDNSVDLFIINPPMFVDKVVNRYGGDMSKQLKETTLQGYLDAAMVFTKHLANALKDTGSIIFLMPNTPLVFLYVERVLRETELQLGYNRIWSWEKGFDYMIHLHKGMPYEDNSVFVPPTIFGPAEYEENLIDFKNIGDISGATWEELYKVLVLKYSREGDVVADIFGGTGTIAAVAKKTNRRFVYNDASSVQLEIAKARYESIKGEE